MIKWSEHDLIRSRNEVHARFIFSQFLTLRAALILFYFRADFSATRKIIYEKLQFPHHEQEKELGYRKRKNVFLSCLRWEGNFNFKRR